MASLSSARSAFAVACSRRTSAELAIDQVWSDAARRTVKRRVLDPLSQEATRFATALERLDHDLAAALKTLG